MSKAAERRAQRERVAAAAEELNGLRAGLNSAYSVFNNTADPELLEASILEIGALQSRYSSALRSVKSLFL